MQIYSWVVTWARNGYNALGLTGSYHWQTVAVHGGFMQHWRCKGIREDAIMLFVALVVVSGGICDVTMMPACGVVLLIASSAVGARKYFGASFLEVFQVMRAAHVRIEVIDA
jgi:hypothetical protein